MTTRRSGRRGAPRWLGWFAPAPPPLDDAPRFAREETPSSPRDFAVRAVRRGAVTVRRYRRLLGALGLTLVVFGAFDARRAGERTVPVVVAARDLSTAAPLTDADVRIAHLPAGDLPDGTLADPAAVRGRRLAAPARRGEVLTDVRLRSPTAAGRDGKLSLPVRISDAGVASLVHVGEHVDVLAAGEDAPGGRAEVVAADVEVLAIPADQEADSPLGALVVLAVTPETARDVAQAEATARLTIAVRG